MCSIKNESYWIFRVGKLLLVGISDVFKNRSKYILENSQKMLTIKNISRMQLHQVMTSL